MSASPLRLALGDAGGEQLRILVIGAHADDIEIGCGGTILRLIEEGRVAAIRWVVLSGDGARRMEAEAGCRAFTKDGPAVELLMGGFRDGYLPYLGPAPKDFFEELRDGFDPDLVLTHRRDDLHQDHRLAGELTWNTFRHHLILEYEVPKYDGDLVTPNVYIELSDAVCQRKIDLITSTFVSQSQRSWFDAATFRGLLRLRGMEAAAPSGFAEGFVGRKALV